MTPLDERPARAPSCRAPLVSVMTLAALFVASPASASDTLELVPDWQVTGILLAAFVAIISPLNRLIFRPLFQVIDEREERIDGARRRAESVQQQAQEALERYEGSIRAAHDAASAERRRQIEVARAELGETTRRAREEAEREIARAGQELGASLGAARESLRVGAGELADLVAERILGRRLS